MQGLLHSVSACLHRIVSGVYSVLRLPGIFFAPFLKRTHSAPQSTGAAFGVITPSIASPNISPSVINNAPSPIAPSPKKTRFLHLVLASAVALSLLFALLCAALDDGFLLVTVNNGGILRTLHTRAKTVAELFTLHSISLYKSDQVNFSPDEPLYEQMQIEISPAFPVALTSGGQVEVFFMQDGTVGDVLNQAGVAYDAYDELTHLPFEDVTPGMHIQHINVEISYETQDEVVEFREIVKKDDARYVGDDLIQVEGKNGSRRTIRRLMYKDGELTSREIMDQIPLTEAVAEVVIKGTKIRLQTSFIGEERLYKPKPTSSEIAQKMVVSEVTAYTHTGNRTATGRRAKIGRVAVNPNVIPYGTKLYIPGYGYCTAEDTGAFRHEQGGMKNQIDIFLNTEQECRKWGRKYNMTVYILK